MDTLQNFTKNELKDRMNGKYKEFYFTINDSDSTIIKKEIPVFYSEKIDYSVGLYSRINAHIPNNLNELENKSDIVKMILNSLFYLNPKMNDVQLYNIWKRYSTINFFPKDFNTYKYLYENRKDINRKDCYNKQFKVVVNELKLSEKLNLDIHSEDFKNYLKNWYKKNARMVYEEWISWEVGYFFYDKISSYDMSEEYIMNYFDIKDKRSLKKYLKFNRISFNKDNSVTFVDQETNELVTKELKDVRDYIIEKNVKYFLKGNKKITMKLLVDECKWVDYNDNVKNVSRTYLFEYFKKNIELKNDIDEFNSRIIKDEELLLKEEKEEKILKPITYRNKWGKVIKDSYEDYKDMFDF